MEVERNILLTDGGLLLLRVTFGISLFIKHGIEKVFHFSQTVQHFVPPLHIPPVPGLMFAGFADGVCSLLIVIGLGTRYASAINVVNLLAVFFFINHAAYLTVPHVEVVVLYLAACTALCLTGPWTFQSRRQAVRRGAAMRAASRHHKQSLRAKSRIAIIPSPHCSLPVGVRG